MHFEIEKKRLKIGSSAKQNPRSIANFQVLKFSMVAKSKNSAMTFLLLSALGFIIGLAESGDDFRKLNT
jgi:hypothetical protein